MGNLGNCVLERLLNTQLLKVAVPREGKRTFNCFPNFGLGFDSHRPLQNSAKFLLIRLPLLTSHTPFCTPRDPVLRPFCAQKYSTRNCEETHEAAFSREAC